MKGSSKRLLAGVASVFLLVLAGTAGILISDKNQKNISGGSGTYWSQEEGKILEIDREKGEITIQRTKDEKEILLDCSKESVMEDITLNSYNTGDQIRYYFWPYEASEDRIKVEELFKSTIEGIF
ncbi:MAG TPA: hypothetical protein H9775_14700 [Candidatus Blautia merdipullorum]|nr:hypothetical protein [Candidatus Blautia merdipullorum]